MRLLLGNRPDAAPRCLAVSPEGVVRCWANVVQSGVYSEAAIELKEQLCTRLIQVESEDGVCLGLLINMRVNKPACYQ